jgi:periplasmic protein CpxP/Spy
MNRPSMPLLVAVLAAIAVPAVTLAAGAFAQSTAPTTSPIIAPRTTTPTASVTPSASVETELPKTVLAKVDQNIKQLHGRLRITPAQQPQWEQFSAVMRDNAAQMA